MTWQYQYQPITGPVWREPVAEKLAWMPVARQPARRLPAAPLRDLSVYPFRNYDPSTLAWMPRGREPRVPVERRIRGDFAQPPFAALYRPDRIEWQPSDRYAGRSLARARNDWTVEPRLVAAIAYDPSALGWLPRGREPRVAVERRVIGDFAQPPFAALYRPERIEWQPSDRYAGRGLPRVRYDSTIEPRLLITVPYDPSALEWLPSARYSGRPLPAAPILAFTMWLDWSISPYSIVGKRATGEARRMQGTGEARRIAEVTSATALTIKGQSDE